MRWLIMIAVMMLCTMVGIGGPVNSVVSAAVSTNPNTAANVLAGLGLFKGTHAGYDLDQGVTRAQGAVMLLRLLGQEAEAERAALHSEFADIDGHWAAAHIAYASSKGFVRGVASNRYEPDLEMTGSQFVALTLRALGYNDAEPDQSVELGQAVGLLNQWQSLDGVFHRDSMVVIAYQALSVRLKDRDITLIGRLVEEDKAVPVDKAVASGLYAVESKDPMDLIEHALRDALK